MLFSVDYTVEYQNVFLLSLSLVNYGYTYGVIVTNNKREQIENLILATFFKQNYVPMSVASYLGHNYFFYRRTDIINFE